MFTKGYELTTGITNIFIFLVSFYLFFKIYKRKINIFWKEFFLIVSIDGLMGFLIHGINIGSNVINILWYILSFMFIITINLLLFAFLNSKNDKYSYKHIVLLTIIIYFLIFIERLLNIEFLYTFIIYAILLLGGCIYFIFYNRQSKCFSYGILSQVVGGILLITRVKFWILDYNGIYHLFMLITIILFYIGIRKETSK